MSRPTSSPLRGIAQAGVIWTLVVLSLLAIPHLANAGLLRKTFNRVAEEEGARYLERKFVQHEARKLARRKMAKLLAESPELRVTAERRLLAYLARHPAQTDVVRALAQEWGIVLEGTATGSEAAEVAVQSSEAVSQFDRILNDENLFKRWLKSSHSPTTPLNLAKSRRVWDKLIELGLKPRFDVGGVKGAIWKDVPHINVEGMTTHIPVANDFTPP